MDGINVTDGAVSSSFSRSTVAVAADDANFLLARLFGRSPLVAILLVDNDASISNDIMRYV